MHIYIYTPICIYIYIFMGYKRIMAVSTEDSIGVILRNSKIAGSMASIRRPGTSSFAR